MTYRSVQQLFDLKGRTAVVTGGSRGLGLQIAHALGEAGASVIISARKQQELDAAITELHAAGINANAIAADIGTEAGVLALADTALGLADGIDILVNNAGATWGALAEEHPLDAWDKVMNLNVRGLFLLTREIGRRSMIPRKSGRIVNIASVAALGGARNMHAVAYSTSKGAVYTFTRALAVEWGPYNINVNAIGPGVFPSKMSRALIEEHSDEIKNGSPLGRIGDDEGLKGAVLLFASDAGKHITRQFLPVDGGASAVVSL